LEPANGVMMDATVSQIPDYFLLRISIRKLESLSATASTDGCQECAIRIFNLTAKQTHYNRNDCGNQRSEQSVFHRRCCSLIGAKFFDCRK